MKTYLIKIISLFVSLSLMSCLKGEVRKHTVKESILEKGDKIILKNKNSEIEVIWNGHESRTFNWEGVKWNEHVGARTQRWYGVLGVYSPGSIPFKGKNGISRICYQEAYKNFESEKELKDFFNGEWNKSKMKFVAGSNGLVGGIHLSEKRSQINVDIWVVTVNNKMIDLSNILPSNLGYIKLLRNK